MDEKFIRTQPLPEVIAKFYQIAPNDRVAHLMNIIAEGAIGNIDFFIRGYILGVVTMFKPAGK